ncbi:MAG TPA: hypothetical protein VJN21_09030 [Candidatus Acidoferrales bacterium]|nr:hypothetical protein [Candidatus Acidoferrales bacterium]
MRPNFSGLWNANLAKSRLIGTPPKSVLFNIKHSDSDIATVMTVKTVDGSEHFIQFRGPITGAEVSNEVLGQRWLSRLQWVGAELLIESWVNMAERQCHFCDFWSLAEDGKTLVMEHRDDDLKGQITFLERVREKE